MSERTGAARQRDDRVLAAAAQVFVERGFAGVTVPDIAEVTGCDRATVYRTARGALALLLRVDDQLVRADESWLNRPASDENRVCWPPETVARRLTARHRRTAEVDGLVRAVAATGVPRAQAVVGSRDLGLRDDAMRIWASLTRDPPDRRVHTLEMLLRPEPYLQLVVRRGWSVATYTRWLSSELSRLGRGRPAWAD